MKKVFLLSLLFTAYFLALSHIYAVETQVVTGPGISTAITRLFFKELSKFPETQDYEFDISTKPAEYAEGNPTDSLRRAIATAPVPIALMNCRLVLRYIPISNLFFANC